MKDCVAASSYLNRSLKESQKEIKNLGDQEYKNVKWNISITIGFLRRHIYAEGMISSLPASQSQWINARPIFGFGPIDIIGKTTISDLGTVKIPYHGYVLGPFVIIQPNT